MSEKDFDKISWLTTERYLQMPHWERALHWGSLYAVRGVREVGKNDGFWARMFLKAVGLTAGYSWCAAFVYFCLLKSGVNTHKLPAKWRSARVAEWAKWAKATKRLRAKPQRGDMFFWLNANGTGHIGFVRNVAKWPESFETIEGNTDGDGSSEGDGVYYRDRATVKVEMHPESGYISLQGL